MSGYQVSSFASSSEIPYLSRRLGVRLQQVAISSKARLLALPQMHLDTKYL